MKGTILEKKFIEHKMCVCWFSLQDLSEKFFVLSINERDMIKNVLEVPVIPVSFNET